MGKDLQGGPHRGLAWKIPKGGSTVPERSIETYGRRGGVGGGWQDVMYRCQWDEGAGRLLVGKSMRQALYIESGRRGLRARHRHKKPDRGIGYARPDVLFWDDAAATRSPPAINAGGTPPGRTESSSRAWASARASCCARHSARRRPTATCAACGQLAAGACPARASDTAQG
jgi:hypothetical protein